MQKTSVLIAGLAAVGIAGSAYWALSGHEASVSTRDTNVQNKNTTIADKWQWNNFTDTKRVSEDSKVDQTRPRNAVPDNVVGIYRILQSIKLDENGRVIPNQTLKEALENGFDDLGPHLSAKDMSELQGLIRTGLVGPAGDEAAQILGNYYQFRLREAEFNRQLETQLPTSQIAEGISRPGFNQPGFNQPGFNQAGFNQDRGNQLSAVDRHNELMQLRRNFLGQEIADKLFAVEDTQARHMFASIAIQQNADLTAAEKQAKQALLQEELNDRQLAQGQLNPEEAAAEKVRRLHERDASSADIYSVRKSLLGAERASELAAADREEAQWQSSFNGFWQARRYVMQAGLDEAERQRQIEQLLDQYFSPEERERARVTSSDWQTRDQQVQDQK